MNKLIFLDCFSLFWIKEGYRSPNPNTRVRESTFNLMSVPLNDKENIFNVLWHRKVWRTLFIELQIQVYLRKHIHWTICLSRFSNVIWNRVARGVEGNLVGPAIIAIFKLFFQECCQCPQFILFMVWCHFKFQVFPRAKMLRMTAK